MLKSRSLEILLVDSCIPMRRLHYILRMLFVIFVNRKHNMQFPQIYTIYKNQVIRIPLNRSARRSKGIVPIRDDKGNFLDAAKER